MTYPRLNCLKTRPSTAAHTNIAYIWENSPGLLELVAIFLIRVLELSFIEPGTDRSVVFLWFLKREQMGFLWHVGEMT